MLKKLKWVFKRHSLLYTTRFRLLSRNTDINGISDEYYNKHNRKKDIPELFYTINAKILKDFKPKKEIDLAKKICLWLHQFIKSGPGLSEPSDEALKIMLDGRGGVCSDMSQIFNNFCVINDIRVREWGVSRAPYERAYGGHSFNEIYSENLNKWVAVDPYYCLFFLDNEEQYLSVVDLFQAVRNDKNIKADNFYRVTFLKEDGYKKNFFNANNVPFLICNYSNKVYDKILKRLKDYLPIFIIHFIIFLLGRSYYYKFPIDNYKSIIRKV